MKMHRALRSTTILSGAVGFLVASSIASGAADLVAKAPAASTGGPAVDGVNAKIAGLGGSFANKSLYGAQGSLALPLGRQFGVQFDGVAASFDNRFFGAGAAHLFWRDPTRALFGIYGGAARWDSRVGGVNVGQLGVEGELYMGRWTLQGVVGAEFGNSVSGTINGVVQSYDIETRFMDQINLNYYMQDDWKVFVGHRYLGGKNALALGSEWGMALGGGRMGSLFVEGRVGEDDFHGVWGGLRFYFGQKDKSLIRRHREDDPIEWSPGVVATAGNSGSQTAAQTVVEDLPD